ncbi:hypothetical protein LCGC14_0235300 [marine sediment metagenome]|uniref:Uncharacterized protein n=1 Tax=marine sediment metagenome TaxID=412755 RepID=A0A0F9UDE0_9ZZZZ
MIEQGDYFVVQRGYRSYIDIGGCFVYDRSYMGWVFKVVVISGEMVVCDCVHVSNPERDYQRKQIGERFNLNKRELDLHRVGQGYLDALEIKPTPQRKGISACNYE